MPFENDSHAEEKYRPAITPGLVDRRLNSFLSVMNLIEESVGGIADVTGASREIIGRVAEETGWHVVFLASDNPFGAVVKLVMPGVDTLG